MKGIDLEKRRRVMERSMELGHCICDVQQTCPCDIFKNQGICPCAGERPKPLDLSQVRLTSMVRNAGCASKIAPGDLEIILSRLPTVTDPAVLSGLAAADDAAIYQLPDGPAVVQTVDVFTPCVDDPTVFGRICAANCLSDVYAMGGVPKTALSIVGFPSETLDGEIMYRMLAGAMEGFAEADVALVGGHSIKETEVKLGFAITGIVDVDKATALDDAQADDCLVLTKPLGTGVLTFCHQIDRDHPEGMAEAVASMQRLNRDAALAMQEVGVSACTDITGFGLFGHLMRMLRSRRIAARIFADSLPAFPGAVEALRSGVIPGSIERNQEFVGNDLVVEATVDEAQVYLGLDAQTSGGLLIAVPKPKLNALIHELKKRSCPGWVIGEVLTQGPARILVTPSAGEGSEWARVEAARPAPEVAPLTSSAPAAVSVGASDPPEASCCAHVEMPSGSPAESTVQDSQRAFATLMRSVQGQGALDERTKELLMLGLVLLSRCEPCLDAHLEKAKSMGISQTEMDEVAWCAIAMGGAPVRMFYQKGLEQLKTSNGKPCC